jgi:thiamine pyrophosphokinase
MPLNFFTATFMDQLIALSVEPGDQDSTTKSIAALKNELADEKLAQEKAQTDTETLSRAVEEIKKTADQLVAHVPSLKTQVKNLNDKVANLNTELRARELSLERTTATKYDFQCQSTRLTKKLEGMYSSSRRLSLISLSYWRCAYLVETKVELQTLKAMVENTVAYFYPDDPASVARAPVLLDGLPTRSREVILANMRKVSSLTLGILKSLYPQADLDTMGEGFAATYTEDEANKLVEDSVVTTSQVMEMLPVDMS